MKIVVIGTGYVGLVAGTCFAETGNDVCCVDIDKEKVARLSDGDPVIYEPGIETLLKKNIKAGRLEFTDNAKDKVGDADVVFLAVGTPTGKDGSADLSYLFNAAKGIAPSLKGYTLVVNKCTAPVGTLHKVKDILSSGVQAGAKFDVASNPEFLKEGVAAQDFLYPDRVVIGVDSEQAAKILHELYEPFVRNGNPIHTMGIKSAELTKYACNCFLATKISFMNDMASLCEKVGADIDSVRTAMSSDHRIGKSFLYAGVGYGGSCFPKDVQALVHTATEYGFELPIVRSAEKINALQRKRFLQKVIDHFKGDVKGKVIAVWGLAFKPQTDDMREAPSIS
jgi:UDPglucose 6-dehydrogenase